MTYQRPDSDRYNYPEAYLRARIVGMLGGRAAEEMVYGTRTTGAENDIEQATQLARSMVTRWGMSDELGLVQLAPRANPYLGVSGAFGADKPFSEETARLIDTEVQRIIGESHDEALRLLSAHRKAARRAGGRLARARDARRAGDPPSDGPAGCASARDAAVAGCGAVKPQDGRRATQSWSTARWGSWRSAMTSDASPCAPRSASERP